MMAYNVPNLLVLVLLAGVAAVILGAGAAVSASRRAYGGDGFFKKQPVAWVITILMIVGAILIGGAKAPTQTSHAPYATPAPEPTAPPASIDSFVWDNARVLSDKTVRTLDQRNQRLWDNYSVTVGVVTCDYGRDDLDLYAAQCAEDMGLGGYDMIVVLDIKGDNYWLLQGNDIRRDFSDQTASDYAYDYMEEPFARGDYDSAVLQLTEMLEAWYGVYYF